MSCNTGGRSEGEEIPGIFFVGDSFRDEPCNGRRDFEIVPVFLMLNDDVFCEVWNAEITDRKATKRVKTTSERDRC